ncbi:CPBP family intramembrane glutamic endopeptidase [Streptomyces hoynatensis]|uniref:CPBP family intramembrane metalloprotease n=1 Tax=Streptomyces hoynatensis TaxID=1141874 RepID=A0A3A9Z140_9ACTN|nr:CPBP family intramembrane glutamic endopeptidase [Streptomyces hoynatensis]RKN41664.1 CPBP family intramembrane metalloprotease [Streptomyces hoynatensis]
MVTTLTPPPPAGRGAAPEFAAESAADAAVDAGAEARGRGARFARSPLGWMSAGLLGIGAVSALTSGGEQGTVSGTLLPLLGAAGALGVYQLVMRRLARRGTPETARPGAGREALLGAGTGLGFVLASVALIAAFGGYSFGSSGHRLLPVAASVLVTAAGAAITEELMLRGIALQALERICGSRGALAVTAALFGLLHLGNPGASLWSSLAIAIEAGVLLGAAFLWRRSIWFAAGLHFAWNATEQLLGIPVSGHTGDGLLRADLDGPALLTGGDFGLEASLVPVLLSLLLALPMLLLAHRRGGLLPRRHADR